MKQRLINALQSCGFVDGETIFLQGTINPGEAYPSSFVTFWTNYTENAAHFDNAVHSVDWDFSVMFYSNDPAQVQTKPLEIAAALRAAGFIQQGKGNDLASDIDTHTGWAMDFIGTETETEI